MEYPTTISGSHTMMWLGATVIAVVCGILFFVLSKKQKAPRHRTSVRSLSPRETVRELDRILDKISEQGLDSLNPEERTLLNSASEKYKSRSTSAGRKSDLVI